MMTPFNTRLGGRGRTILAAATVGLAGLAVAACGGDGGADAATTSGDAVAPASASQEQAIEKLSANTATEAELQTIPGVGENIAHEIVEYRPYDAATGPARFRDEMAKYIDNDQIEAIIVHLDFSE